MWPWLKSNVSRSWYIRQCSLLRTHYSTWPKHSGKWHDRRQEKHCQFCFLGMNTTKTQSLNKLKSDNFQSYPRGEAAEFYVEWQLGSTKRSILTFIMITGSELFDLGIETFTGAALSKWIVILLGKKITPMTVAIAKQKKIAKRRYRTLKYNIKKKT